MPGKKFGVWFARHFVIISAMRGAISRTILQRDLHFFSSWSSLRIALCCAFLRSDGHDS